MFAAADEAATAAAPGRRRDGQQLTPRPSYGGSRVTASTPHLSSIIYFLKYSGYVGLYENTGRTTTAAEKRGRVTRNNKATGLCLRRCYKIMQFVTVEIYPGMLCKPGDWQQDYVESRR